MKVLSAFPHKNYFPSDLIFVVIYPNICKPTAWVSEFPSLSALRREIGSGCDEVLLPMRSQPCLETEHMCLRMVGFGDRMSPVSAGLQDRLGVRGEGECTDIFKPHQHLESASGGRTRNHVLKHFMTARFAVSVHRPCPSPEGHGLSGLPAALHLSYTSSPGTARIWTRSAWLVITCLFTKAGRASEGAAILFSSRPLQMSEEPLVRFIFVSFIVNEKLIFKKEMTHKSVEAPMILLSKYNNC